MRHLRTSEPKNASAEDIGLRLTEVLGLSNVEEAIGLRAAPSRKLVSAVPQMGDFRPRSNLDV